MIKIKLTKAEEMAMQQLTGMHYSEGRNVVAVCIGMGLTAREWKRIKPECEWLSEYEVREIEVYYLPYLQKTKPTPTQQNSVISSEEQL